MGLTRKDFFMLARTTATILKAVETNDFKGMTIREFILSEIRGFCREQNSMFDNNRFETEIHKLLSENESNK